jgi:hypothetical protein
MASVIKPTESFFNWAFDVGPFAGTPTTLELGGHPVHGNWPLRAGGNLFGPGAWLDEAAALAQQSSVDSASSLWQPWSRGIAHGTWTTYELIPAVQTVVQTSEVFSPGIAITYFADTWWPAARTWLGGPFLLTTPVSPIGRAPSVPSTDLPVDRELSALEEIRHWLGFTYEDIAAATGIGLRTVHYWKQEHPVPRPRTVQALWRLYTLVRSLRRSLGPTDAVAWLRSGDPSPLELIRGGHLTEVEDRARSILFGSQAHENPFSSLQTRPEPAVLTPQRARSVGRSPRRVRTGRAGS